MLDCLTVVYVHTYVCKYIHVRYKATPIGGSKKPSLIAQTEILIVPPPQRLLSSLIPMSQNILGGSLPDDDEIDHDKTDTFKPWLRQPWLGKVGGSKE